MNHPVVRIFKDLFAYGMESFGRYYSTYRAFVYSNDDPQNMQRLQLIIPEVGGNAPYEYWAYPHGVFSGPGYGTQVIPQKSEVVWVSFESGHPEVPIWHHGYPAIDDVPNDKELQDKNCYWFKTPQGNLVKINDTKNHIEIQLKDGQTIKIDDKAISLITDKKISLGSLDSSNEKAMLGDSTKDLLGDIKAYMETLSKALAADILLSTTTGSTSLKYVNLTTAAPQLIIDVAKVTLKLEKILSNKTTLD